MRLEVRLNPKNDKDIIDALSNAKNVSREARKLLRKGLNIQTNINSIFSNEEVEDVIVESEVDIETLKENLLSNDFDF